MKKSIINLSSVTLLFLSAFSLSETTPPARVDSITGHLNPNCRTVKIILSNTQEEMNFRLSNEAKGEDDITAILLSAKLTNREVIIDFQHGITTGCGTEPKVIYATLL